MSDSKTKLCNFRLPIDLLEAAKAHATDRDESLTAMIERLICGELRSPAPLPPPEERAGSRARRYKAAGGLPQKPPPPPMGQPQVTPRFKEARK